MFNCIIQPAANMKGTEIEKIYEKWQYTWYLAYLHHSVLRHWKASPRQGIAQARKAQSKSTLAHDVPKSGRWVAGREKGPRRAGGRGRGEGTRWAREDGGGKEAGRGKGTRWAWGRE